MTYQPFLIAPFTSGLETDLKPWLLPKDAFQSIVNGFIHNGVLSKRRGFQPFGNMVYDGDIVGTEPIMGIKNFIDTDNQDKILIFDTRRAAIYNSLAQEFDPLDVSDIFAGTASSFISSASFGKNNLFSTSTFFFTNFNGDTGLPISPMRTFTTGTTTNSFVPDTNPTGTANYVIAAQFIFAIRSRLLILNTVESSMAPAGTPPTGTGTNFPQRMRWSRAFNPTAAAGWDEVTPGNGGFIDASTSERIIGAAQLEDTIIVQFTNSIWQIEPTSDPAVPFRWIKINSFRSCDAPYANISHDRFIISFGKRGIVASDRTQVQRIDQKIEDFMMNEVNIDFVERMYSERDYTNRRSWTLYPSSTDDLDPEDESATSNFALIRTEEEGSWSIYEVTTRDLDPDNGINMSSLGYGRFSEDATFDDFDGDKNFSFNDFGSDTWDDYFNQAGTEIFLGGDQFGRILALEQGGSDMGLPINFEVASAGWNPFAQSIGSQCQMGYVDFYVDADTNTQFTVDFYSDDIDSPYASQTLNCLPNLGFLADITDVSLTNPVQVQAPSNGLIDGQQIYIYGVNGTDELDGGPYTVIVIDEDNFELDGIDATGFTAYESGGQIVQRAFENVRCWKRAYAGGKGYQHFVDISNSGTDDSLRFHAFMPWFRQSGNRIIGG